MKPFLSAACLLSLLASQICQGSYVPPSPLAASCINGHFKIRVQSLKYIYSDIKAEESECSTEGEEC